MRAILVSTVLLLGIASAAPEPELFGANLRDDRASAYQLVAIESVRHRGDRLTLAALQPRALHVELLRRDERDTPIRLASLGSEFDAEDDTQPSEQPAQSSAAPSPLSLDNLCNTLFTSAHDNDLPVPFFANLLWQESRLRNDVVSKKGAVGIAQFMPKVAVESGLADPFDPMQAIPASARFLQRLWLQFGNLGFVAAAYNAGPRRVIEWLENRGSLPRETHGYVMRVTGLSVETWRRSPIDNDALTFVPRLPCRRLPAFANVEQEQMQQAQFEGVEHIRMPSEEELDKKLGAAAAKDVTNKLSRHDKQARHHRGDDLRAGGRRTAQDRRLAKHETAKHEGAKRDLAKQEMAKRDVAKHDGLKGGAAKHQTAKHEAAKHEAAKHEAAHGQRPAREKRKSA